MARLYAPHRRFADVLTDASARIRGDVDCYSFIAVDFHHILLASFSRRTHSRCGPAHSRRGQHRNGPTMRSCLCFHGCYRANSNSRQQSAGSRRSLRLVTQRSSPCSRGSCPYHAERGAGARPNCRAREAISTPDADFGSKRTTSCGADGEDSGPSRKNSATARCTAAAGAGARLAASLPNRPPSSGGTTMKPRRSAGLIVLLKLPDVQHPTPMIERRKSRGRASAAVR